MLRRGQAVSRYSAPVPPLACNPTAVCRTSAGTFSIELFLSQSPLTASNVIGLIRSGFYDGLHIHRVIPGTLVQFGCPRSRDLSGADGRPGSGGPPPGSTFENISTGDVVTRTELKGKGVIPDERVARISNAPGTLAMANTGPNSAGSQFFVNVRRSTSLDWFSPGPSRHVVFGQVIDNFELIERMSEVDTGDYGGHIPATPIQMESIVLTMGAQPQVPSESGPV